MRITLLKLDPVRDAQFWAAVTHTHKTLRRQPGNDKRAWGEITVDAVIAAVNADSHGTPARANVLIDVTSLTNGLSQLTARAGSAARHADLTLEAQQAIHAQVEAERESISGVNLDEEAADMLRFQQAYQAAAQVIATADTVFQSLLGAIRR